MTQAQMRAYKALVDGLRAEDTVTSVDGPISTPHSPLTSTMTSSKQSLAYSSGSEY